MLYIVGTLLNIKITIRTSSKKLRSDADTLPAAARSAFDIKTSDNV